MPIVYDPAPVFLGLDGLPLNGGWVGFFEDGTDTPKAVYSDSSLGTPVANPQVLGADGRMTTGTGVWYGTGKYRVRLYDSLGAVVWTRDGIDGEEVTVTALVTSQVIETVADMVNLLNPGAYGMVTCLGYFSEGDGGGGVFRWVAWMSTTPNNGTIFQPGVGGVGRWVRLPGTEVDARWFGATTATSTCATFLGKARDWAIQEGLALHLVGQNYDLGGNIGFTGALTLIIDEGVVFGSTTTASDVEISCPAEIRSESALIGVGATLTVSNGMNVKPEWWGVTGAAGETTAWEAVDAGCVDSIVELSTSYVIDGATLDLAGLHFRNGADLDVSSLLAVNLVTYDERPDDAWLFKITTPNDVLSIGMEEVEAWWFYGIDATVDSTYYTRMVKNLTSTGTKPKTVRWNRIAVYEIASTPTDYELIVNKIEPGTVIKSSTAYSLGPIVAGNYQVFDPTAYGPKIGQSAPLEWWGGKQNDNTLDNGPALYAAHLSATYIDGLGTSQYYRANTSGGYYVDSAVTLGKFSAKDLCIRQNATGVVNPQSGCAWDLSDCTVIGLIAGMALLTEASSIRLERTFISGDLDLRSKNYRIIDCDISGQLKMSRLSAVNNDPSNVWIVNNRAQAIYCDGTATNWFTGTINGNTINGVSTGADTDWKLTVIHGQKMSIVGNVGTNVNNMLFVEYTEDSTISNNTFKDLRLGSSVGTQNTNCAIIGNVSTSATAANVMYGDYCTVLGNTNMFGAGTYTFTNSLPAVIANYNV